MDATDVLGINVKLLQKHSVGHSANSSIFFLVVFTVRMVDSYGVLRNVFS